MANINITVDDAVAAAKIAAMVKAAKDLQPLHQRIGASLKSQVELGFKASQSPYGQAWKRPLLRNGQPLRDTGRLRASITSQPDADGVTVGTNLIYARIHQYGGTIKAKNAPFLVFPNGQGGFFRKKSVTIPARPYLPLDPGGQAVLPEKWEQNVVARVKAHFLNAANGGAA